MHARLGLDADKSSKYIFQGVHWKCAQSSYHYHASGQPERPSSSRDVGQISEVRI